ncbi:MAG TPA: class I SAM-dependent methyltransferase [Bryobacteraceae bacterium]|jgi:SAM-dependent methyltransferase
MTVSSFRDPGGRLTVDHDRVRRQVFPSGLANLAAFTHSTTVERHRQSHQIVGTRVVSESDVVTILEHEKIPFPSYPHEWAPQMLYAAAELTLSLAEGLAAEGKGLKDATPQNVLFRGTLPVFVDVLSFEPRNEGDPIWLASAQFTRTFLLPLMMNRELGTPLGQVFLTRRDGVDAIEAARALPWLRAWRPPFLGLVTLPRLLSRRVKDSAYRPVSPLSAGAARFVLERHFKRLRKLLRRFEPLAQESKWSSYADDCPSYTANQRDSKTAFVAEALKTMRAKNVLDVGANSGEHSLMAAAAGASVVAIDSDEAVCGRLFLEAAKQNADVLPLAIDFARPSPSVGWRNSEQQSFLDRAAGAFDGVMMLAVLHHLLVSDQAPLDDVFEVAAQLTRRWLLIEYIDPSDAMFRKLARGRDTLYEWLTREAFVQAASVRFEIVRTLHLPDSQRSLYLMSLRQRAG